MPKISVVIPIYNTEKFLEDCLRSVKSQTFKDFEAILMNDGSTDKSTEIAKKFVQEDARFHLQSQANAGLSEARNAGILQASGEWITFVDSDDILHPQFLDSLLSAALKNHVKMTVCGKQDFGDAPEYFAAISNPVEVISNEEALVRAFYQNRIPDHSAWNKLYHKSLWENRKFPKGIYFEDIATIPGVFRDAEQIAVLNEPLYFYRKRKGSILASDYDLKKTELLSIAEKNWEDFKTVSLRVQKAAESLLLSTSFSILMRTENSDAFKEVRARAWEWILKLRLQSLFDSKTRLRNKVAASCSFGGKHFLNFILRRFG